MERERADSSSPVEMVEGLFSSPQEYEDFVKRHAAAAVRRYPLSEYTGAVWMGIDAGSTTLKAVLIDRWCDTQRVVWQSSGKCDFPGERNSACYV